MQHSGLFLSCNWMHLTKGCSWRSQGRREATTPNGDWSVTVLRSMSQQCHRLQGRGRKRLLLQGKMLQPLLLTTALQLP